MKKPECFTGDNLEYEQIVYNECCVEWNAWVKEAVLSEGEIRKLFSIFQVRRPSGMNTETGIPDWQYKDLSEAIRTKQLERLEG